MFRRSTPTEAVKTPRVFSYDIIDGTYIDSTKYGTGMYILQLWIYVFSFLPRDQKLSSGYLKVKKF